MAKSERLEVRVSQTLYRWVEMRSKSQGFKSKAAYLRYVLESLRMGEKLKIDKGV